MARLLEILVEILSWLKIVASPFLLGLFLGFLFYLYKPNMVGIIIGGLIATIGLVVGILFATKISKKMRPSTFNARISASPELDEPEKGDASNR